MGDRERAYRRSKNPPFSEGGSKDSEPTPPQKEQNPFCAAAGATQGGPPAGRGTAIEGATECIKIEIESRTHCSSISVWFPHTIAFHVVPHVC